MSIFNIEREIVEFLRHTDYNVLWMTEENPRASDEEIIALAVAENRIIITGDKDFGELVFCQHLEARGIILLRVRGQKVSDKAAVLQTLLNEYSRRLEGYFVVATPIKLRFIPLPHYQ